jgi:hypothetical protein
MRVADSTVTRRPGIALPLALLVLVVVMLFAALLLDGALQEVRMARGGVAASRAQAALESTLAATLATPVDSAGALMAAGRSRDSAWVTAGDTLAVHVQSLGGTLRRVVARATIGAGSARAVAGAVAYLRVATDSNGPGGGRRLRPVTGWWWAPIP